MGLFDKKTSNAPMWLVVGLGNPGVTYEKTRHNAGFILLDRLAEKEGIAVDRLKFKALTGQGSIGGVPCLLMKPQTYMNNSGESVAQAAKFYKIPAERILVICDDITRDPGAIRIRRNGSHGGQNGMRDICACLGSSEYPRIRLGIGDKPHKEYDLAKWVLSKFTDVEWKELLSAADRGADAVRFIVQGKTDEAMNRFNSARSKNTN